MSDLIDEQIKEYDRLYKEQDDFYRRAAQIAGLSDAAHWVLYRLYGEDRDMTQSELCSTWYFSKQTINSAVNKLKEQQIVELSVKNGAGNRKEIKLTAFGKRFCKKNVLPVIEAERKAFEVLTEEERDTMLRLMKKQLDVLKGQAEELWQ